MPEIVLSVLCVPEMLNMLLSFQRIKETKKLVPSVSTWVYICKYNALIIIINLCTQSITLQEFQNSWTQNRNIIYTIYPFSSNNLQTIHSLHVFYE